MWDLFQILLFSLKAEDRRIDPAVQMSLGIGVAGALQQFVAHRTWRASDGLSPQICCGCFLNSFFETTPFCHGAGPFPRGVGGRDVVVMTMHRFADRPDWMSDLNRNYPPREETGFGEEDRSGTPRVPTQ